MKNRLNDDIAFWHWARARQAKSGTSWSSYWSSLIQPYLNNPVLSKSGNEGYATFMCVLKVGAVYHAYYQANISGTEVIQHATSLNGKTWTKDDANNPVLSPSAGEWDSSAVGVPMVWIEDGVWYMLYRGHSGSADETGLATSNDGLTWTKNESNPVLRKGSVNQWDGAGAEMPGIIKVGNVYYAYYEANTGNGRSVGVATSTDLITWTKDINNPIMTGGRFCPGVFKLGGYYFLLVPHYTSGSDYAEIELYKDVNPTFYPSERIFVGVIKSVSDTGWDSMDQDTPFVLTDDIFRNTFTATNNEIWIYYAGQTLNAGNEWSAGLLISSRAAAPIAPSVASLTVVSSSTVNATCAINATDIDGVSWEYSADSGVTWVVSGTSAEGAYTYTALPNDTALQFRQRNFKGSKYSSYSEIAQASTPAGNPNIVANGGFDSTEKWTLSSGALVIGSGVCSYDKTGTANLKQAQADMLSPIKILTSYILEFDIGISSGNASIYILNSSGVVAYKAQSSYQNGHNTVAFTTPANIGVGGISFYCYAISTNAFTIDNIELKEG